MIREILSKRLEAKDALLSPFAVKNVQLVGRASSEEGLIGYTDFQLDRNRIVHSNSFRRLKHKTQVFIAPHGDHYVTRLTHTLEVAEVSRAIARGLNLNEDLCEAIALGHDLGHTPFGHVGEDELNRIYPGGFKHSEQSLRIVESLENNAKGLNLTWEVKQGIVHHSKARGDFFDASALKGLNIESQVCSISDAIAYINHDIGDAIRADIFDETDLPDEVRVLGQGPERLRAMISDIISGSWDCSGERDLEKGVSPVISASPNIKNAIITLREFLFEELYLPASDSLESEKAREIINMLYQHFCSKPELIPSEYSARDEPVSRRVVDYLSGMTDRFALRLSETINPGISGNIFKSL